MPNNLQQARASAPSATPDPGVSQRSQATSPAPAAKPIDPRLSRARLVLMAAFGANGLLLSTWFSRLPSVADRLQISASQLGVVSAALTVSTLVATPLAAKRLPIWRATRIVRITSPLTAVAMFLAVASTQAWQLALGLLLVGFMNGVQGVGLNAHGTTLSRLAERSWMPAMLGAASAAGVLGAAAGTIATAQRVPLLVHVGIVAGLCSITGLAVSRQIPIGGGTSGVRIIRTAARDTAHRIEVRRHRPASRTLFARRIHAPSAAQLRRTRSVAPATADPVTRLLIGAALGATLAESALANFGIVLFRDVLGAAISTAAMAFTVFSIAMAIIRLSGERVTERLGPWLTMTAGGVLTAVCGLVLVARPPLWLAFAILVGIAVGIGCAVPVSFQLATSHARTVAANEGADPERAAAAALSKLGLASSGGYLSGGPLVGAAASLVGLRTAVLIVAIGGAALAACAATLSRSISQPTHIPTPAFAVESGLSRTRRQKQECEREKVGVSPDPLT
ncbi:MAG: hypothetical protein QOK10_2770 [Pseudonocardiales bacterium]|nr:hypothetical protein [Pseudonocardiales bacterium]